MVQPRKEQIKSVNTKFTFGTITGLPGYSELTVPIDSYSVTKVPNGAEEDVPAVVLSSIPSSYPILAGDSFRIAIDGAPGVLIVLTGTDITVSRVASRINTTLGFGIAFNRNGRLFLQTITAGSSSSIVLSDVSPGVLFKLGLSAGTYTGLKGPIRGVLTRTPDGLGGLVRLATQDGRHLVTDATDFRMNGSNNDAVEWTPSILGGIPIHGRLTHDGSNYILKTYAKFPSKASVTTFNSSFSLLDSSDQLTIETDGKSISIYFPSPPYTKDQVIDAINDAWGSLVGQPSAFSDGKVVIHGTNPGPFYMEPGDSFSICIDGGVVYTITMTGTEKTVTDIVNTMGTIMGFTCSGIDYLLNDLQCLKIFSLTTNGRFSSVELNDLSTGSGTLRKLGLRSGLYRGSFIAESYGPDEIRILSPYRGANSYIQISGIASTLTKMGLTAGNYPGSDDATDELVSFPYQSRINAGNSYKLEMIFSEVLEFGEIDPENDTRVQNFLDKSAGSNQASSMLNPKFYNSPGSSTYLSPSFGITDVGKPVTVGPDGSIDKNYLQAAFDHSDTLFKQFLRYSNGAIKAIVSNRFEGTGYAENSLTTSPYMQFFLDPINDFPTYGEFDFFAGASSYDYSKLIATIARDSATFGPNTYGYVGLVNGNALVSLDATLGPLSTADGLKLASSQTINAGGTGRKYIPFTAAANSTDGVPRLAEASISGVTTAGPYSIMRTLNARHEVTLGDGISTFGDFNGSDALHQVQSYLQAVGATRATIKIKSGWYVTSQTVDFSFLTDLVIDGYYENTNIMPVLISHEWVYECLHLPLNGYTKISGIAISNNTSGESRLIWAEGGILDIEGCWINAGSVYTDNVVEFRARKTQFIGRSMIITTPSPWRSTIELTVSSSSTHSQQTKVYSFEECYLSSTVGGPVLAVYDYSSLGVATVELIKFSNCSFDLSNITVSRSALTQQGGIISFSPSGDAYNNLGAEVKKVQIYDCDAWTNFSSYGSGSPMIINAVPSGWSGSGSYSQGHGYPAMKIDNFDIKRLYIGYHNTASSADCPAIGIGGIGVDSEYGGKLTLEDVVINTQFSTHGRSTSNMTPWFTDYTNDNYGNRGEGKGGFACLAAKHIEVKNVTFLTSTACTDFGEFFFCSYGKLDIDGIEIPAINGGPGSPPETRICIRETSATEVNGFNIRNVRFYNLSTADSWANDSIILVETRNNRFVNAHISDFYLSLYCDINCVGIHVAEYGAFNTALVQINGGITIENGYIGSQFIGSSSTNGFTWGILAFGDNIKIQNVVIDSCVTNGISGSSFLYGYFTVENCTIQYCGNAEYVGDYSSGLCLFSKRTSSSHGMFNVLHNQLSNNNASPSDIQANIRDISKWGAKTTANVYGNSTLQDLDYLGQLNVTVNVDTNIPAGFVQPSVCRVKGVECGYSGNTGVYARNGANGLLYIPDFWPPLPMDCIHNLAKLTSDISIWK